LAPLVLLPLRIKRMKSRRHDDDRRRRIMSSVSCQGTRNRGNGGVNLMNCYLCLVETGCASRAAVAVCQRCGAGMCGAHLRELSGAPVAGLAGTPRSVLLCCRCAPSPVAPAARPMSKHQETQQGEYSKSGWRWWGRRRHNVELPKPAEAVAAVERFLNRQHHG